MTSSEGFRVESWDYFCWKDLTFFTDKSENYKLENTEQRAKINNLKKEIVKIQSKMGMKTNELTKSQIDIANLLLNLDKDTVDNLPYKLDIKKKFKFDPDSDAIVYKDSEGYQTCY